ncbi:MAG: hypothetical protein BGO01_15425 [Armatimonadetes bacterium 55-13]|nr:RNA polymerase sigma factor [Armatimonadota bacterium]OJU65255.1 MAG: hypothetical protein BGO01_15425 [Armatimonadetes bacterium 55-13]
MNDAFRPKSIVASRALSREVDFVEDFLNRYRDTAFRIAMRIMGSVDAAEDVAQEALIRAFKSWDRMAQADSQVAWVKRIVVRCALTALERQDRFSPIHDVEAPTPSHQETILVQSVLATLPPDQRVILSLIVGEGWSYKELAENLDIPMGTVASRVHAAKSAFRKAWEELQ